MFDEKVNIEEALNDAQAQDEAAEELGDEYAATSEE